MNTGSSEHMCLVVRGGAIGKYERKLDEIGKRHGYSFVYTRIHGTGWQGWFAGPNRGYPFDDQACDAIARDLIKAGFGDEFGLAQPERLP